MNQQKPSINNLRELVHSVIDNIKIYAVNTTTKMILVSFKDGRMYDIKMYSAAGIVKYCFFEHGATEIPEMKKLTSRFIFG